MFTPLEVGRLSHIRSRSPPTFDTKSHRGQLGCGADNVPHDRCATAVVLNVVREVDVWVRINWWLSERDGRCNTVRSHATFPVRPGVALPRSSGDRHSTWPSTTSPTDECSGELAG